jgi:5-methylthioadenosine/S-adenosylhomocysteine deaminase
MCLVCDRRGLLRGIAATALGGAWAYPASAQARRDAPDAGELSPKGEYLLKDAFVMTMDPQLGNISKGSVHVKDGEIVDVDT